MYSTKSEGTRYVVTCLINDGGLALVDTIVDTGAMFTCYKAEQISPDLSEEQFENNEFRFIGGFIDGQNGSNAVKFYKYFVKQFTIGTIDIGDRIIWITFDRRINDNVLGMDILKAVAYLQYDNSDELVFFKDKDELKSYVNG